MKYSIIKPSIKSQKPVTPEETSLMFPVALIPFFL